MSNAKFHTNRLYCRSSYLSGWAHVFNIYGNYCKFNYSKSQEQADIRALQSDWEAVGMDMQKAIDLLSEKSNVNAEPARAASKEYSEF
jgi:hypothetical protein